MRDQFILCACGCGTEIRRIGRRGQPILYAWGHNGRRPREQRFWEKVEFGAPDECWLWTAARDRRGYGMFEHHYASRVAYTLTVGDPGDLDVLHACDNPPCCNPLHLWAGTAQDNIQDAIAKGRFHYRHPKR